MDVVVTRERGRNESLRSWLPRDAMVTEVPLTTTRYIDAGEFRSTLEASDSFGAFRMLVVTSSRSANYVSLAARGLATSGRIASVGETTAASLAVAAPEVSVDIVGHGGALDLATKIVEGPVLVLGAAAMRPELPGALRAKGLEVTELACYETVPATLTPEDERAIHDADVVVIGAPSAWSVAASLVSTTTWVVVPGATTATVVRRTHERVLEGWGPELRELLATL